MFRLKTKILVFACQRPWSNKNISLSHKLKSQKTLLKVKRYQGNMAQILLKLNRPFPISD